VDRKKPAIPEPATTGPLPGKGRGDAEVRGARPPPVASPLPGPELTDDLPAQPGPGATEPRPGKARPARKSNRAG
jgi:hypothetical protein